MITQIEAKNFSGVPYLETSDLMVNHSGVLKFSKKKPNVIVGPNGAGKSALLKALALHTLTWYTGETSLDNNYIGGRNGEKYWSSDYSWSNDFEFLKGLTIKGDNAPALFYRPNHIPGNEQDVTHSMMTGYFDKAKAFGEMTRHKSSGQQSKALLEKLMTFLNGSTVELEYNYSNWNYGKASAKMERKQFIQGRDYKAEILKDRARSVKEDAIPVLLMDEPEQSLDAKEELKLWRAIESADCKKMQIIIASHSLFPLMFPERFNIIEATPEYCSEARSLLVETT